MKIEDENIVYVQEDDNNKLWRLFKLTSENSSVIYYCNVKANAFWTEQINDYLDLRLATPEESHYMNEMIKADKFIPYEEAMKTFKEKPLTGRYAKFKSNWNTLGNYHCYNPIDFNKAYKINREGNYIGFKDCSGKCVIIDEIYEDAYIPVEVLDIMPEGWTPEQEKPQYEVGKWYKTSKSSYVKFSKLDKIYFNASEYIHYEKGYKNKEGYFRHTEPKDIFTLVDLSEIQQYLPDRHEDKLPIESKELFILEQAKLKYPVGTKYELAHKPNEGIIHVITGDLTWGSDDNIYGVNFIDGEKHDGCVYYKGQWAKIITHEIPQKINNSNSDVIEIGDEIELLTSSSHNSCSKWYNHKIAFKQEDIGSKLIILDYEDIDGGAYKVETPRGYTALRKSAFKLIKKASQTTLLNKKVDGISPVKVNTKLLDIIKIKGSTPTKVEKKRIKLTILKTKQLNLN